MIQLGGERTFWIGMGAAGAVVLVLLVAWAIPAYSRACDAEQAWQDQMGELEKLERVFSKIPSESSVEKRQQYRKWLDEQADLVKTFFYDRSAILVAPLAGEGEVSASQFKESYNEALLNQKAWLIRNRKRMKVESGERAYPTYDWVRGSALPDPKRFESVLRLYWTHYYLYRIFIESNVRVVQGLKVGRPVYLTDEFRGLPFHATLLLYPEDAKTLLKKSLTVSPDVSGRPVIQLRRFLIQPESSADPANTLSKVRLEGYVLLFRKGSEK